MTIVPGFSLKNEQQCFNEDKVIVVSSLQVFPELIARGPLSQIVSPKNFETDRFRGEASKYSRLLEFPYREQKLGAGVTLKASCLDFDTTEFPLPFRIDRTRICDIQFPILISVLTMTIISPNNIDKFVQHRVDLRLTIESRVIGQLNKLSISRNKGPRFFY